MKDVKAIVLGILASILAAGVTGVLHYIAKKHNIDIYNVFLIFIPILAFISVLIVTKIMRDRRREVGQVTNFNTIKIQEVLREDISWQVVWNGAERLFKQIVCVRGMFPAGETMFMGVNALGTAIGTAMAYRYGMNIPIPIGVVQTSGGATNRKIECIKYPYSTCSDAICSNSSCSERLKAIKHVLIIDGLMKTGNSAKIIKNKIVDDFKRMGIEPDIKVAILILCRANLSIYKIWKQVPVEQTPEIIPDFMSYFTHNNTVKLPWDLR